MDVKKVLSELLQDDALTGGENAGLLNYTDGNPRLNLGSAFLQARPNTIYSGSNEIQRGIIAKNVLELPG